jgi:hypothetical protein
MEKPIGNIFQGHEEKKMNWKDFFKITWWKIIFTILLFGLFYFSYVSNYACLAYMRNCNLSDGSDLNPRRVPLSCAQTCTNSEYYQALTRIIFFAFLIPVIVFYLISCSMVWIYNKLRKIK